MSKLTKLMEKIDHALNDAYDHAMLAIEYKDEDKELSTMFTTISTNELANINAMHIQFNKLCSMASTGASDDFKDFCKWENKKIVERMAEIKSIVECNKK